MASRAFRDAAVIEALDVKPLRRQPLALSSALAYRRSGPTGELPVTTASWQAPWRSSGRSRRPLERRYRLRFENRLQVDALRIVAQAPIDEAVMSVRRGRGHLWLFARLLERPAAPGAASSDICALMRV
jgi:hypothetical protein